MSRSLFILSIALLLSSCSNGVDEAKQILENSLSFSKKLEFANVRTYPGEVVCGEYSTDVDHFGARVEGRSFITVRGQLYSPPRPLDEKIFCSKTPAAALLSNTGIGPYDSNNAELARITADMSALVSALEAHYRNRFIYPRGERGLEALLAKSQDSSEEAGSAEASNLKSIPPDPWGRPYLYQEDQWGRTKGSFTITTLGADGMEGGGGENADVSSAVLPYLQHIATVLAR